MTGRTDPQAAIEHVLATGDVPERFNVRRATDRRQR